MSAAKGRWADLLPRALSAVVMVAAGGYATWAGGLVFNAMIALCCGGMIWELVRMLAPERGSAALQLGAVSAIAVLLASLLPPLWVLPVLAAPVAAGISQVTVRRQYFAGFALWVLLAGFGFIWLRGQMGVAWMLWLIGIVVATDVTGYFAGKAIGGPKFWPRVSPKKTWSGTASGWLAAAIVGAVFANQMGLGYGIAVLSVLLSMASQAGDVAESALKRMTGVKDSSALIPGHGGLFDRFDGMLGAAAMFLAVTAIWG
ncbi:phosphatidate cytidylyltransferase [Leisingera sp. McT4-56]|uniref:phosphatidate cytidylyltransferase n=1 Tax=Leisingera sp. McT4-56 TaxID=2881255 RepID=UPI001CF82B7A|nr:phosphatidate cytidylyltransferase [Leisingera sp. McT4-56]MCB4454316.1 phosphatidate cytidylyltransferase [Leisingera sp. McT4-56]